MWSSLEGLIIGGRYELGEHLATGGMAVVFKGWDHRVERPVAIKMLRQLEQAECSAVSRFRREAHAVAVLNHPNVVRAYDFFEEHGCSYLVMEYVDGLNLKQWLRRHGPLPEAEAVRIAEHVCAALEAAHAQGFIHRDIKPQNILLDPSGIAKVADFGIVHITRGSTLTSDGTVLGTADYIAPEQARGELLTPATDVYALGVVLYEMLTGQLPFVGATPMAVATLHATEPIPPPSRVVPSISPYVEAVVLRALQKHPARRYQSAAAFAYALRLLGDKVRGPREDVCAARSNPTSGPPGTTERVAVPALAGAAERSAAERSVSVAPTAARIPSAFAAMAAVSTPDQRDQAAAAEPGESWRDVAAMLLESAASVPDSATPDPEAAVPAAVAAEPATHASWLRLAVVAVTSLVLLGGTLGLELWLNLHTAGMGLIPLP